MESLFSGNIDFCPDCGAILPVPGHSDYVSCRVCTYKINISEFDGLCIKSKIVFNKKDHLKGIKQFKGQSGPLVDRKCSKCGHEGMTYATLQTRSVDEGQTVFYSCPQCKHQENENS